jgi:hypothetical protein
MSKYSVTFVFVSISIVFSQLLLHIYVQIIYFLVNYGVVLLLGVESLMVGSTTGVPMSPGYGGYQTATPASYHNIIRNNRSTTPQLMMSRTTTPKPQSIILPRVTPPRVLHHQGSGVLHHQGSGVLHHKLRFRNFLHGNF